MMEPVEKELKIGEIVRKVVITPLPSGRAGKVSIRIGKLLGGLLHSQGQNILQGSLTPAVWASMAMGMCVGMSDDDYEFLCKELLYSGCIRMEVEGKVVPVNKPILDGELAGHVGSLFHLLMLSAEVSFGSFFEDLSGSMAQTATANP